MLLVLLIENDNKECRMVVTDISTGLVLKTMRFGVVNDPMLFYHTPSNGKYVLVSTEGLPDLMSISEIFEKETEPEMWRRQVGGEMAGNDVVVSDESPLKMTKTRLVVVQHSPDAPHRIVVLNFWEVDNAEM